MDMLRAYKVKLHNNYMFNEVVIEDNEGHVIDTVKVDEYNCVYVVTDDPVNIFKSFPTKCIKAVEEVGYGYDVVRKTQSGDLVYPSEIACTIKESLAEISSWIDKEFDYKGVKGYIFRGILYSPPNCSYVMESAGQTHFLSTEKSLEEHGFKLIK